ncbi:YggS family pyridoxal phosphate-dependent enzyme [Antrihabitans sp. NCIMB 15449]|uniref:Pyridoxal phosphate homeostasis protein n=1 Tax=Antrihabitans spumae TaxID=3373370 RepID=A0ABW7JSL4_9NOCA
MSRGTELASAFERLESRVAAACSSGGRRRDEVVLLPVTKFFPVSDVEILYRLGAREFGESREQEATAKVAALASATDDHAVRWHMIGRLQRNKARAVAGWAYAIHSVDNAKLVRALDKASGAALAAGERAVAPGVLLQVSLDDDPDRGGVSTADLMELADQVANAEHLELTGLMAIPPVGAEPGRSFATLQELQSRVLQSHPGATQLSAGMSGDLEIAIEHGSTCVRVGTALLGTRPIN